MPSWLKKDGRETIEVQVLGETVLLDTAEVRQIERDINSQIYARDFALIDQADMIVSFIPELADGMPALSSGVERELQHATKPPSRYMLSGCRRRSRRCL